jgi:hypothetical protein
MAKGCETCAASASTFTLASALLPLTILKPFGSSGLLSNSDLIPAFALASAPQLSLLSAAGLFCREEDRLRGDI